MLFKSISKAEINHEELFADLAGSLECSVSGALKQAVGWICPVCGYSEHGRKAPLKCPLCGTGRNGFAIERRQ